jgi:hypothetical protein
MSTSPSAFVGPAQVWQPSDNSYLAANGDPLQIAGATILIAGTLYLSKLKARAGGLSLSAVRFSLNAAGVGASTGSFGGLYSSAGLLLSGSADAGAALLGTGDLNIPLSAPGQPVPAGGFVWAALLVNLATTQPTMNRYTTSINTGANLGLAAAALECAVNGTGLASLPASITPASNTGAGAVAMFAAAS